MHGEFQRNFCYYVVFKRPSHVTALAVTFGKSESCCSSRFCARRCIITVCRDRRARLCVCGQDSG